MEAGLHAKLSEIRALCKTHNVEACYVFGSATSTEFHAKSDYDLLVRFSKQIPLLQYADNYFDLLEKLTLLLNRKIDLISEKSLKNPVLIQEITNTRVPLYES
jgi:predicted nucleotidyltransferase